MRISFGLILILVASAGCTSNDDPAVGSSGRTLYEQPMLEGNVFACATCHALSEPAGDGLRRPGHPIGGAPLRASFKNGKLTDVLDAVNSCLDEWMNAPMYSANDPDWFALRDYLAQGGSATSEVTFTIKQPPAELAGGNANEGRTLFNSSCAICHGQDAEGDTSAPSLVGASIDAELIARRVRTSGRRNSVVYGGLTGGVMPFWSEERLIDDELRDIVAYVEQRASESMPTMDASVDNPDANDDAGPADCPSTHPSVGKSGELDTFAHQVAGTVTVVNDCTLRVDNFTYDGGGLDVRWYAAQDRNYNNGVAISPDIFGMSFENETIFLTLPDSVTLDNFNSVSVWCVDAGANFGDTLLE